METLGSVSITALLHRLIMLCVQWCLKQHDTPGVASTCRLGHLPSLQKLLRNSSKNTRNITKAIDLTSPQPPDLSLIKHAQNYSEHIWSSGAPNSNPQKPKDQFLTDQWSGWETPQDTLRYVCVHPLKGQSFFVGKRKTYTTWARCCQSRGPSCIRACYTCYQYVWKIQREEAEHISLAPTRSASLSIHLSSYQADFNILLAAGRLPVTNWDG